MKHPILEDSGYKYYGIAWIMIIIAHAILLFEYYELNRWDSILDSVVFNLSFCGLGLGFWYIVRYVQPDKQGKLQVLSAHVIAALISVSFWVFAFKYVLRGWSSQDENYIDFLESTTVIRIIEGVVFYMLIVLVYYLIQYYQNLQDKIKNEFELRTILKDTELKALKSQINPHFIFNSLNSVSALTIPAPEKARDMVIKLSEFLRFSLAKDNDEQNTLDVELKNANLYLDIEKVRFGERLNFELNIGEDCKRAQVPNLILQPIFENAIKYGVSESIEPVNIRMNCSLKNDSLSISITNDYDPTSVPSKGEGIGLKNIDQRLNLIYGNNATLSVSRHPGSFEVMMIIPQPKLA